MSEKNEFLSSAFSEKYRLITGLILGFLALVLLVLIYNIYAGSQIKRDQKWVDVSGRMISAASSMTTSLLELQERGPSSPQADGVKGQLVQSYGEFGDILYALQEGAEVSSAEAGLEVQQVPAVPYARSSEIIDEIAGVWERYSAALRDVVQPEQVTTSQINNAADQALEVNPELMTLLRNLNHQLQQHALGITGLKTIVNIVFLVIAPLYCGAVLYFLITRLRQNDAEIDRRAQELNALGEQLEGSKEEIDNILNSVSEGLFLLDKELTIGTQHSAASLAIFNVPELSGKNFLRLFHKLVPAKTYDTAKKYMALVFKPHIEEATLAKFNPFKDLEVHFDDPQTGGLRSKYLDFRFKRIFNGKKVEMVMVSVSDVTERIRLERQLRESEEATQRQLEMMLDILHCDVSALDEFLEESEAKLRNISSELKGDQENMPPEIGDDKVGEYRKLLDRIFRIMHTIKGNAAMIQLRVFESKAHEFEEIIMEIKNKRDLHGGDFLPITVALSEMLSYIKEVRDLMGRMGDVQSQIRAATPPEDEEEADAEEDEDTEGAESKKKKKKKKKKAQDQDDDEDKEAKEEPSEDEDEDEDEDQDQDQDEDEEDKEEKSAEADDEAETQEEEEAEEKEDSEEAAVAAEGEEVAAEDEETAKVDAEAAEAEEETQIAEEEAKEPVEEKTMAPVETIDTGGAETEEAAQEEESADSTTTVAVAEEDSAQPETPEETEEGEEKAGEASEKPSVQLRSRPAASTMVGMLGNLADNIAQKYDKKVQINAEAFDEKKLPQSYKFGLRDIIVQLVRNSVIHGIENVEEREVEEKDATGTITLKLQHDEDNGDYHVKVADDGRGLPREKLQKKAVEQGMGSADEVTAWEDSKLYAVIFETGMSTADEVTEDAGRGVGMDVVRETIDEMGGIIEISSKPGEGCEFHITLPKLES